jgi:predicted ArsR family transcriptional regulator
MKPEELAEAVVPLERDGFLRTLLRHLSGTLQDVVGLEQAEGFVSVVGRQMGEEIAGAYREAIGVPSLEREHLAAVLVDLKSRIQGDFYIIEETEDRLVLGNRQCPFGDRVRDRPSLCMMTTNVFGTIAAEAAGAARVEVEESIADGHGGCRVTVTLSAEPGPGRTFFRVSRA